MSKRIAIGIDLGTTNSCVGIFQQERIEIIANDHGNRITPSCVAFTNEERLIGDAAKYQIGVNPFNTVFGVKRLIGRKFDDPVVQSDMKHWPFDVINENGEPRIQVKFKGQKKTFLPEEISSMVLGKMKDTAEAYLGQPVNDAFITVPAYFNDNQQQATIDAATICGLNVLRIINEPTAAGIAFGLDKSVTKVRHVMIFDLGGGTLDVSILKIEDGIFDVKAASGDTHLGGEDLDSRLVNHFLDEIKRKHKVDLSDNKRAIRRLRSACEIAKKTLSTNFDVNVTIDCLIDGNDFISRISRARFEELCIDLFRSTLEPVKKTLKDSGLKNEDIDEIVLVGGSARIPKIQKLLQEFFNGKKLNQMINADEAVAFGAAVQAAKLSGDNSKAVQNLRVLEVTPLSLGVGSEENNLTMSTIIKRNTRIPAKQTRNYTNRCDNQTTIAFPIYEGESPKVQENNYLGEFKLTGLPPLPKGKHSVDVTFEIDANGILHGLAVDKATGKTNNITITKHSGRPSKSDIQRMKIEAEMFRTEYLAHRDALAGQYAAEICVLRIKSTQEKNYVG